jgi:hypothetical protein
MCTENTRPRAYTPLRLFWALKSYEEFCTLGPGSGIEKGRFPRSKICASGPRMAPSNASLSLVCEYWREQVER